MDMRRAFLAISISFIILLGYQYFFVPPVQQQQVQSTPELPQTGQALPDSQQPAVEISRPADQVSSVVTPDPGRTARAVKETKVETDYFTATISEQGGAITSFVLKNYREENDDTAPGVNLVKTSAEQGLPLTFSWGSAFAQDTIYTLSEDEIVFDSASGKATVELRANTEAGLEVIRRYTFSKTDYLIDHSATVINRSGQVLQGMAGLHQRNLPFVKLTKASDWLFRGPAYHDTAGLHEIKLKEFQEGKKTIPSDIDWVAYEGTYFMCGIIPTTKPISTITLNAVDELVSIDVQSALDTLAPNTEKTYSHQLFYGPKKLSLLKQTGANLAKIINFGWFDVIAKPMLYLLNWFYAVFSNYGVAIILVTVILKALFWPITQKGLKSMKNMQKLQPKMVKIKEKYKGDPTKMNQEMMNLYKTYKVNPLGGCLPMVLQIPVFFALYKVLLQSIELRHAPFMLWITDLSAPDRLYLGFDLPYLGGLPVLTLLMGASMFLQQKMTPTTADPTQAKIMMFLPVIFTVMFVNFASGLVLYWFVNNLLSILQQYLINRQRKPAVASGS
jgi:YidC/Oxa1 family membrane protein insertase